MTTPPISAVSPLDLATLPNVQNAPSGVAAAKETAVAFEAVFLTQIVNLMMDGISGDHAFGGGHAEDMWRSVLSEHIADAFAERGGLNIASQIQAEILRLQGSE